MRSLFIFKFLFVFILIHGQGMNKSVPVVENIKSVKFLSTVPVKSETGIDELINVIKFEKGDTIFTPNSLLKLNQLIFSYPDYGFRVIGLNNKAAYFIERRWKAIRNYLLKSGGSGICVEILASGSLKSFTYKQRVVNIVIYGD